QPYGRVIPPRGIAERAQPHCAESCCDQAGTENTDSQVGKRIAQSIELRPERVRPRKGDAGERRCEGVADCNQRSRPRETRLEGDVQTEASEENPRDDRRTSENDSGERDGSGRPHQRHVLPVIRDQQPQPSGGEVGDGDEDVQKDSPDWLPGWHGLQRLHIVERDRKRWRFGGALLRCTNRRGQEPATIVSARPSATQARSASGSSTAAVSLLIPMSMDPRWERSVTLQAVPPVGPIG